MDWIQAPWPWYISGLVISGLMFFLIFSGKTFGFSSNFRTACAALGFGKRIPFFDYDWKTQRWNLWFAAGAILGGWISAQFVTDGTTPQLSTAALTDLQSLGLHTPTGFQPLQIFSWEYLLTWQGWVVLVLGGFLVGFGTRWAGGCTSGHAITGLSNLQWPSLLAVVGFFIGGLFVTWFIWPHLANF